MKHLGRAPHDSANQNTHSQAALPQFDQLISLLR